MKIGILGTGNIGSTLGRRWAATGHKIQFGVRDLDAAKHRSFLRTIDGSATISPLAEALSDAEVIVLAIPGGAVNDLLAQHGDRLQGKIVIDATNKVGEPVMNSLDSILSSAPTAHVFRAFNSLGEFRKPKVR